MAYLIINDDLINLAKAKANRYIDTNKIIGGDPDEPKDDDYEDLIINEVSKSLHQQDIDHFVTDIINGEAHTPIRGITNTITPTNTSNSINYKVSELAKRLVERSNDIYKKLHSSLYAKWRKLMANTSFSITDSIINILLDVVKTCIEKIDDFTIVESELNLMSDLTKLTLSTISFVLKAFRVSSVKESLKTLTTLVITNFKALAFTLRKTALMFNKRYDDHILICDAKTFLDKFTETLMTKSANLRNHNHKEAFPDSEDTDTLEPLFTPKDFDLDQLVNEVLYVPPKSGYGQSSQTEQSILVGKDTPVHEDEYVEVSDWADNIRYVMVLVSGVVSVGLFLNQQIEIHKKNNNKASILHIGNIRRLLTGIIYIQYADLLNSHLIPRDYTIYLQKISYIRLWTQLYKPTSQNLIFDTHKAYNDTVQTNITYANKVSIGELAYVEYMVNIYSVVRYFCDTPYYEHLMIYKLIEDLQNTLNQSNYPVENQFMGMLLGLKKAFDAQLTTTHERSKYLFDQYTPENLKTIFDQTISKADHIQLHEYSKINYKKIPKLSRLLLSTVSRYGDTNFGVSSAHIHDIISHEYETERDASAEPSETRVVGGSSLIKYNISPILVVPIIASFVLGLI